MYWQNQRPSTLMRKLECELDDGTPWNGMERMMGLRGLPGPLLVEPLATAGNARGGPAAGTQVRSVRKDLN
jgi:hypothetical protein